MITPSDLKPILASNNNGFATVHYVSSTKPAAIHKHLNLYKEVRAQVQLFHKETGYNTAVERSARMKKGTFVKSRNHFVHDEECYSIVYSSSGNELLYCRFIRVLGSKFFVDGEEVSKEEYASYLTPSERKKLLEPVPVENVRNDITHTVVMRTIGLKNIISLTFAGNTVTNCEEVVQ